MAGPQWKSADRYAALAQAIDHAAEHRPASRPAPVPPLSVRPKVIPVTDVDRLKADPYAFYAKRILRLARLDPVDADAGPAWRGTAVPEILQQCEEAGSGDQIGKAAWRAHVGREVYVSVGAGYVKKHNT